MEHRFNFFRVYIVLFLQYTPFLWYRRFYETTVFTFHTIAQLQRHLVADLFWYSGVPTNTFTIHSLSKVVVPATLHSIPVNAHFTRFFVKFI
jgi:hypothetical protein